MHIIYLLVAKGLKFSIEILFLWALLWLRHNYFLDLEIRQNVKYWSSKTQNFDTEMAVNNFCWLAFYYTSTFGSDIYVVLSAFFVSSSPTTKINPRIQQKSLKGVYYCNGNPSQLFFSSKNRAHPCTVQRVEILTEGTFSLF